MRGFMDTIAEQLIKKQMRGADYAKMVLITIGGLLLSSVFMFFSIFFRLFSLIFISVGILALTIWLLSNSYIEYEYIVTNNEMDVDKIIGKRKRKRMITVDLKNAESFEPYASAQDVRADATVHASDGLEKNAHQLIVTHSGYGKVKLIFNPNERIREAIMQEIPNSLRVKIIHNVK